MLVLGLWFVWPDGLGDGGQSGDEPSDEQAEGEATDAATATLEIREVGDHDPFGDGDRSENPDEVGLAVDGDPGTAWTTVGYNSAGFGGLKDGVGLWFDLGEAAPLDRITVTSDHPGYRLVAYVIAAMLCALAGVLLANQTEFVSPAYMGWHRSGDLIVMVVLGGIGTLHGAIIGAAAYLLLEEFLQDFTEHWRLIFGPILVLVVLFGHGGLVRLLNGGRKDG